MSFCLISPFTHVFKRFFFIIVELLYTVVLVSVVEQSESAISMHQFSSVAQSCPTLWPHGLQHARLPCPSPIPGASSNSCPLSLMPSIHLIHCHPLLLLPSIFSQIRVFSKESVLRIRWPKYWSFSLSISPSNEYSGLTSFRIDWWISLQSMGLSRVFSNTTVQKYQFFSTQLSL